MATSRSSSKSAPRRALPSVRTRTPSTDIEATVIQAATRLLQTSGPDELSIRRIATEANVAPMTLYNRFGSKQAILDLLFIDGFRALDTALDIELSDDPFQDLLHSGRRYRQFALDNPTRYQMMFLRAVPDYEPSEEAGLVATGSFLRLTRTIEHHQTLGNFAAAEPIEVAQRIWSAVHGAVALELMGIGFVEDQETHLANLCRTLTLGLTAAASASPPRPRQQQQRQSKQIQSARPGRSGKTASSTTPSDLKHVSKGRHR
jgi:AcrR family transcriptional regulator